LTYAGPADAFVIAVPGERDKQVTLLTAKSWVFGECDRIGCPEGRGVVTRGGGAGDSFDLVLVQRWLATQLVCPGDSRKAFLKAEAADSAQPAGKSKQRRVAHTALDRGGKRRGVTPFLLLGKERKQGRRQWSRLDLPGR
jgi:hypothetical protein